MPESTVMPPTPPAAAPPTVMPPTTPTTGGGLRYHGRNHVGYPPPPTNMPPSTHAPLANDMVLPQYTPFYMAVIQYMLLAGAAGYAVFRNIRRPVDVPPGGVLVDNAVEGGAQQRVATLFHFLVINFTEQFFNSNLAHYLIENLRQGDPFFMNTRFGEWTRMLLQQAVANSLGGEPLFPDQTEIPISRLSARQAAEALLRYYEGLTTPENAIMEAIRRYLARQPQDVQKAKAQDEPQDEPQEQPEGRLRFANERYSRDAREYVARLSNVPPSQYTRADLLFGRASTIMTDIKRKGIPPRFDSTFDLSDAIRTMTANTGSSNPLTTSRIQNKLAALNGFIQNYGEQVEQIFGPDVSAFLDLLVRVMQHFATDREP